MLKKLIILLSLVIIPMAFAVSMINSTEINNLTENLNNDIRNINNPMVNCIYNCTREECLCTEKCLFGEGINHRMNRNYNNSINNTEICPRGCNEEDCICGFGMYRHGEMHGRAYGMGHRGMCRGACGGPRFAMTTE
ncbi:hypothetical protein KKP97_01785 [Methanothermococcus sp. SCGC AD-155-C09]|nr:hypothetical protein [Methanothermococcus sp. SCGC AD-155-C09]